MRTRLACVLLLALAACGTGAEDDEASETKDEITRALESVPPDEAANIKIVTETIEATVRKEYEAQPEGQRVAHRDAHAKHHGCVRAEVSVEDSLPARLRSDVFKPGAKYPAWIRFSNGAGGNKPDQEGDGRGLALKIIGVDGPKLLGGAERDATTQDFLLVNHPVFFVRNVADYVDFQRVLADKGSPIRYFFPSLNPFSFRLHELAIARALSVKKIDNPLHSDYFSMTAILFKDRAVKVAAIPCERFEPPNELPESRNYLREALSSTLASKDGCFNLAVQERTDPWIMPVEDPTEEWEEGLSPWLQVAQIKIPKQSFESPAQMAYCENLSFTPWHTTAEHRPLGGLNRARRVVYETISRLRHDLNGVDRVEPKDLSVPNE